MLTAIHIGLDPVAVHLGPVAVHWYGIAYVVAFVTGFRWGVLPHLLPRGVPRAECDRMLTWTIVAALLGARLYYVVQQPLGPYLHHPLEVVAVWRGGMDAFGAIFATVAMIAYLA
ncbi:MAG: prolipoprotein diacylglyceryl transferase family protein, partial [Candidatus Dormibacteria bacterium]